MRSNPKNENWRGLVRMHSVETEYENEVWELLDAYAQAHTHATACIDRLKQRERNEK